MFKKILIANRGEIALRIIRTCKELGVRTVAVYSEIDSRSRHVQEADEAVFIGPSKAADSYLVKEKLIAAALDRQCQAIHPGYGFLSENAEFADQVTKASLVFIGPPASAISLLGDKIASKKLAIQLGIPVVPGSQEPLSDTDVLIAMADEIGYPVLLKPAAGGGGKGMRVAAAKDELEAAARLCREEARKAFGDNRLFLERYITHPRHIEMQIIGDRQGHVVYLGERECSIQRRYQKIIEESPSPGLKDEKRKELGEMSCRLAMEAGYHNVGTVEFIMDGAGRFYFLEMNTRLQVEHPVTEMVTGLDLVALQLRISDGEPLPFTQEQVQQNGWAMEARICAEDPGRGILPATGMITRYAAPRDNHLRVDSGIEAGSFISAFYDSLLAKVIAWGENRRDAVERLIRALNGYHIEGLSTNVDFVNAVLNHPVYQSGDLSTRFIEDRFKEGRQDMPPEMEHLHYMAMAATLVYHTRQRIVRASLHSMIPQVGATPAHTVHDEYVVKGEKDVFTVRLKAEQNANNLWEMWVDETPFLVITPEFEYYRRRLKLKINGQYHYFRLQYEGHFFWTAFRGITRTFEIYSHPEWELAHFMPEPKSRIAANVLPCPMPGLVVDIRVKKGDTVFRGQDLVSIESMKMENYVASPCDGVVEAVKVTPGQAVETGDILVEFKQ